MVRSVKAEIFNKEASDPRNKADEILKTLKLQRGWLVADVGAGGGYFSLRFAETVRRVFAVDVNLKFLEYIRDNAEKKGLENIETVLISEDELNLPEKSLNLIFMRNICHHIRNRVEYFRRLKRFLKPDVRVAIIERSKPSSLHSIFGHYLPRETIIKEMEDAGFTIHQEFDFLRGQTFIIFIQK